MRPIKEELLNIAMARKNGESLYAPLKEYEQKQMEKKAMKEYEQAKMSVGIHFAQIQITELIKQFKNGEIEFEQFQEQMNEVFNCLKSGLDGFQNIDKFEKQRAWENLIKSIRQKFV